MAGKDLEEKILKRVSKTSISYWNEGMEKSTKPMRTEEPVASSKIYFSY